MELADLVRKHPNVFQVDKHCSAEHRAVKDIAVSDSYGSDLSKAKAEMYDYYSAFKKLIDFGFRKSGMELAEHILMLSDKYQQYHISMDICSHYIYYHSLQAEMDQVHTYNELHDKYSQLLHLEKEARMIYAEVLCKYKTGQDIDVDAVVGNLANFKALLPQDSIVYHVFFYQVMSMVHKDELLEYYLIEAIEYFSSLYFNHDVYENIFVKLLIEHYQSTGDIDKCISFTTDKVRCMNEYTPIWYRFQYLLIELIMNSDILEARRLYTIAISNDRYQQLNSDRHVEWDGIGMLLNRSIEINV